MLLRWFGGSQACCQAAFGLGGSPESQQRPRSAPAHRCDPMLRTQDFGLQAQRPLPICQAIAKALVVRSDLRPQQQGCRDTQLAPRARVWDGERAIDLLQGLGRARLPQEDLGKVRSVVATSGC